MVAGGDREKWVSNSEEKGKVKLTTFKTRFNVRFHIHICMVGMVITFAYKGSSYYIFTVSMYYL